MKITAAAEIAFNGPHCWLCDYSTNGGAYCQLFRARLEQKVYPEGGDPPLRCAECLEAEKCAQEKEAQLKLF